MATPDEAEVAGQQAAARLAQLRDEHPADVACVEQWWRRHYTRPGHRRLGRLLLGGSPYTRRDEDAEDDPEMDAAIQQATEEFAALRGSDPTAVALLAQWWRESYIVAGHRRLGR